ncbi:MAG: nicotinamide riboside transporter PnuC [Cytophagaceae bacterium]|nr:nicotinamide riboside transporter PnuC [Cytophagaceae bacterium]
MGQQITEYIRQNPLELAGIITTLWCVWLNTRQNIWGWFWAIVSSGIYGVIYYQARLYSDMELQGVFIALSVYGWYQWLFGGKQKTVLPVSRMPLPFWLWCGVIFLAFTGLSGYLHGRYTNASFPYFDSGLTAISLVAQWQMARKYLENWILWIVADAFYVILYFTKNLQGTALLYALLLGLAAKGYWDWKRSLLQRV